MDNFQYIIVHPDGTQHKVEAKQVISELYYKLARVPTKKELPKGFKESYIMELKKRISQRTEFIPLFDIHTKNIYIIEPDNLYQRIAKHDYRLPDEKTGNIIMKQLHKYTKIINSYGKKEVPKYFTYYVEQLNKHISFLNNYDIGTLTSTFYRVFFYHNPSIRELTTCRRPSFYPSLRNKPYYTKTELINMALNMNLKVDINNLEKVCETVSDNDISYKVLNDHKFYIEGNNAVPFVQLYTFIGSAHMNTYLRRHSERDVHLENRLFLMWSLIRKAPEFDKNYYLFRFVSDVSYLGDLKVGDIFTELSFISTTRNPFYNPKNNIFGYNLIKIKVPKGKPGIGLCIESQSFFSEEEEIVLAPGRLKLVSIDDNFTYHHPNETAQNRIQRKYEFVYLDALAESPLSRTIDYDKSNKQIKHVEFSNLKLEGSSIEDEINGFINDKVTQVNDLRYFTTKIGKMSYLFQVYYREDLRAYDRYFFIQKPDHIYFICQDEETKEIIMYLEIREKISVNFIFRFIGGVSPFKDEDLLEFLSHVSLCFNIKEVIIHDNYSSYEHIADQFLESKELTISNFDNPDTHVQQLLTAKNKFYPVDVMNYVISKGNYISGDIDKTYIPRFNVDYIQSFFKKDDINELTVISAHDVLSTDENNVITKLYFKFIKQYNLPSTLDFYLYLHFNYFYLIRIFNKYLKKYYEKVLRPSNLWDTTFHIFYPFKYLYLKGVINKEPIDVSYDHIPDSKKSMVTKKIRESVDFEKI
jgi:hypothetical protein